jgi:GntR family transcriptional regulator, transcriptional repressor for pyruvate dehydrogenase complex
MTASSGEDEDPRARMGLFPSRDRSLTAVETVVDTIRRLLVERKLKPGDLLPSENEIAGSLSISRGSIREAMKILSAFGVVDIKRGDGTYVATSANKRLFDPILFQLLVTEPELRELAELRLLVEEGVLDLVVEHGTEEDFGELEAICARMEGIAGGEGDAASLLELDGEFHDRLGAATRNRLVANVYSFVIELLAPTMKPGQGLETHRAILDCLRRRDLDAALEALRAHDRIWSGLDLGGRREETR